MIVLKDVLSKLAKNLLTHSLPSRDLFDMQWHLTRVVSISGAADIYNDNEYNDNNSIRGTHRHIRFPDDEAELDRVLASSEPTAPRFCVRFPDFTLEPSEWSLTELRNLRTELMDFTNYANGMIHGMEALKQGDKNKGKDRA